ncbi:MAG TPA: hypothetical protein VHS58_19970 [Acetobacteraceae bacterium]|jgi:hypothetical protein|nr:hypothetical protein [Acetobacteraceae bacterium]
MRQLRAAVLVAAVGLAGCRSASEITGLAAGAVAGGATANPAIGYGVAVGTAAAGDELFKWIARSRQHGEQEAIAAAAADLPDGGSAPWRIDHTIPIDNEHGDVRVIRTFATPLATCREIVFSVLDDPPAPPALYATDLCRNGDRWEWALAEPAVPRWSSLQ